MFVAKIRHYIHEIHSGTTTNNTFWNETNAKNYSTTLNNVLTPCYHGVQVNRGDVPVIYIVFAKDWIYDTVPDRNVDQY